MVQTSVCFKTCKANFIHKLLDALKEFMSEASLRFTPEGIALSHVSTRNSVVANLLLPADKFEQYSVSRPRLDIGVSNCDQKPQQR